MVYQETKHFPHFHFKVIMIAIIMTRMENLILKIMFNQDQPMGMSMGDQDTSDDDKNNESTLNLNPE
eukprot:Pgem_evm1s9330